MAIAVVMLGLIVGLPAVAQDRVETLLLESFRFEHQPASESLSLIEPLLSRRGTVSVDRERNTVVVRDHASVVGQLRPLLAEFDHPRRRLRLEVYLLRAYREPVRAGQTPKVPREIGDSLTDLLAFKHYVSLGELNLVVEEGELVQRNIGSLQVGFRAGTILLEQRLPLHSFELSRETGGRKTRIFHANVNLKHEKALLLTVSADRQSQSGVVVALRWRPMGQVSPPVPRN